MPLCPHKAKLPIDAVKKKKEYSLATEKKMKSIDQTKDGETDVKTVAQSQSWQSSQTSRWE